MSTKDEFGLLPKQRIFVDLYLGGMFATQALRAAGYRNADAAKAAHRMLQRKAVRAYLKAERERLAKAAGMEKEVLVNWLCRVILTPIGRAADENRDLLEMEKVREYRDGRSVRRVRMVSKMAAVRQLVSLMGWGPPERREAKREGEDELTEIIRRVRKGNAP